MAMGTRKQREKQEGIWIAHAELASAPAHPFYQKLNELLEAEKFDEFVCNGSRSFPWIFSRRFRALSRIPSGSSVGFSTCFAVVTVGIGYLLV